MKRILTDRLFVAGAIMAAVGIIAAGLQGQQPPTLFGALQALNGDGATKEEFGRQYQLLDSRDSHLSLSLALVLPWLVSGEAAERIYTNVVVMARTGGGTVAPPRSVGSVTNLTITSFNLGTTSLFIRAEWPPDVILPYDWIYLEGKQDLNEEDWQLLGFMDVDREQGWAEQEFLLGELMWDDWENPDIPGVAFFRLQIPEVPEDWDWEPVDDDDGDPPDILPLLPPPPSTSWNFIWLSNGYGSSSLTETVPVEPGQHYLITVHCSEMGSYAPPPRAPFSYSWTITAPGLPVMSGGTDSYEIATICDGGNGYYYALLGFWFITIPTNATRANVQVDLSSAPISTSPYCEGWTVARIKRLSLHQSDMPLAAQQSPPGSTDNAGYANSAYIPTGGTAFITGWPLPPTLTAGLSFIGGDPPTISYAWRLTVETERPDYRGTLDNKSYPFHGGYTTFANHTGAPSVNVTQSLMDNEIIGGKCVLYCKVRNDRTGEVLEKQFPFFIKGMNPKDADVVAYANTVMPAFCKAQAIACLKHETRAWAPNGHYYYNQFNPVGGKLKWLPNKTDDTKDKNGNTVKQYGWGIGQIDRSRDTPPGTVSTAEVWNWRTNVTASAQTFNTKLTEYQALLKEIKANYPNEWVEPLATTTKYGVTWTHEQWAVTVLYNKATGVKPTTIKRNGKPAEIRSPLRFDPKKPTGQRWSFEDNGTNYAKQVSAYLPPNVPPPAVE